MLAENCWTLFLVWEIQQEVDGQARVQEEGLLLEVHGRGPRAGVCRYWTGPGCPAACQSRDGGGTEAHIRIHKGGHYIGKNIIDATKRVETNYQRAKPKLISKIY